MTELVSGLSGAEWPKPLRVSFLTLTYAKLITSSVAETHGNSETVTSKTAMIRCAPPRGAEQRRRSEMSTAARAPTATKSQIRLRTVTNFLVFYRTHSIPCFLPESKS